MGVVTAVPVVVTFVDRVTGKIVCREEIGGGRHRDHRRTPTALYATENDARRALGLPPRAAHPQIAGEQLELGAAT